MGNQKIRKRNGQEVNFDRQKIAKAISKANHTVPVKDQISDGLIGLIAMDIERHYEANKTLPTVESVQDAVIMHLMKNGAYKLAMDYTTYRYQHELRRKMNTTDQKVFAIVDGVSAEVKEENANKNTDIIPTQRDYIAGEVSRDLTRRYLLPPEVMAAHDSGLIHFHDADYFAQHSHNCELVNLDDMLQNGTVITGTLIEKPHRFSTACNIATQIVAQVASNSYGGQTFSMMHLAKFVDLSRIAIRKEVIKELNDLLALCPEAPLAINAPDAKPLSSYQAHFYEDEDIVNWIDPAAIEQIVENRLKKEIKAGIQTIQYQVLTLMTTNGQAPFVTLFLYLNEAGDDDLLKADLAMCVEEVLNQRIEGVKNEQGVWITPSFPKLIYVLEEDNIHPGDKYFNLTELAAKCTAKRMVPDYISEKIMLRDKGDVYPCMGCRSFLTPDQFTDAGADNMANAKNYVPGQHKYYGRFNQGVVTINLPYVAMSSGGDLDKFWEIFESDLELCHKALRVRHERLLGTTSDVAPIMWQYGALARLKKGETIDKLLYNGYSTLSLGYAGLYEAVYYLTGHSHTDPEGKPLALAIMHKLNDKCMEWRQAENIHYSLYGTPLENCTYKFAKALRRDFGIVENVSDHDYITNSYHVNVREQIDAFTKLEFEAEFQTLSPGGAVSYVEVPNLQNNIPAVIAVIQFIYDHIMYAELNTKSDYCQECGYDGEMKIVEDGGKLVWECPKCGNRDQHKMNVSRRTCGYIGTQFWNQGRTQEIRDRVMHL